VYGSRFRTKQGRQEILSILKSVAGWAAWSDDVLATPKWSITKGDDPTKSPFADITDTLTIDDFVVPLSNQEFSKEDWTIEVPYARRVTSLWQFVTKAHNDVVSYFRTKEFIDKHGLYLVTTDWLWDWMRLGASKNILDEVLPLVSLGASLYAWRIRHQESHPAITSLFSTAFKLNAITLMDRKV
jgi:hypothetical protein